MRARAHTHTHIYIFIYLFFFIYSQSFNLFYASLLNEIPGKKAMIYLRRYKRQPGALHILVPKSIRDLKRGVGFKRYYGC